MRALMSWSGGKDACAALMRLREDPKVEVCGLLTTLAIDPDRVGVHEVAAGLIRRQARALGLALTTVRIAAHAPNAVYEAALAQAIGAARDDGVDAIAYGDLRLQDIRDYRDGCAERMGVAAVFPVWDQDVAAFADAIVALGIRAVVCAVDTTRLSAAFAGRDYDATFLADLPPSVDPCGENGEFHTFVYDAPGFAEPIGVVRGAPLQEGAMCICPLTAR